METLSTILGMKPESPLQLSRPERLKKLFASPRFDYKVALQIQQLRTEFEGESEVQSERNEHLLKNVASKKSKLS